MEGLDEISIAVNGKAWGRGTMSWKELLLFL